MNHQRHVQNSGETVFTGRFGCKQEVESREALMGLQSQQTPDAEARGGGGREPRWAEAQTDNAVIPQLPEGQTRHREKREMNEMQNKGNANTYRAATGETASERENGCSREGWQHQRQRRREQVEVGVRRCCG